MLDHILISDHSASMHDVAQNMKLYRLQEPKHVIILYTVNFVTLQGYSGSQCVGVFSQLREVGRLWPESLGGGSELL
jgi:hypothetical protein